MSNAGRPPVPTWLKELRGTAHPATVDGEPRPEDALYVPPPGELANRPAAREYWETHLPLLVKNRMITEVDMAQFALLCVLFEDMIEAEQDLQTNGKTQKTENGYIVLSPYFSIAQQRRKEYIDLCREFGLTPSSRTRLKIQIIAPGGKAGIERDEHQAYFQF